MPPEPLNYPQTGFSALFFFLASTGVEQKTREDTSLPGDGKGQPRWTSLSFPKTIPHCPQQLCSPTAVHNMSHSHLHPRRDPRGIPASLQGSARAAPPVRQSLPLLRFVPCQGVFRGHRCPRGGCCSPSARLGSGQQCGMRFQGNRRLPARGCARRRAGVSVLGTPEPGMAAAA